MNLWTMWTETLDFNRRLKRKEFFIFSIAMALLAGVTQVLLTSAIPRIDSAIPVSPVVSSFSFIFSFPILTASIKRLHDAGHRAWWILVPLAGFIFLFFKSSDFERDWSWGLVLRPLWSKFKSSFFVKTKAA